MNTIFHVQFPGLGLEFTIDPASMQQANDVLEVRDARKLIMRSWHIWR